MAENRRDRDKRFYFSRGQMILLGGAFTLAAITIFLLGMFVGTSIEARKMVKADEPLVRFPVKSSAQAPASSPDGEPTVFENQTKVTAAQPLAEETPKAANAPDSAAKTEVKEKQAPVKEAPPVKAAEKKAEKAPPEPAKKATADEGDAKDAGKNWRIQINAYPDELSAKQLVDRLNNKSYNAYITEVRNKGKIWYRVSVGKYASREEADKMLETLKVKENFTKAFATTR